jgi:putative tricarboxylic transport membrane protein
MLLSQGSLSIFWANPLVASIAGLAILLLVWPVIGKMKHWARSREAARGVVGGAP